MKYVFGFMILVFAFSGSFAQKGDCKKYFYKSENDGKSAFNNRPVIKTLPLEFYKKKKMRLSFCFIHKENNTLEVVADYKKGGFFNRQVLIGKEQKIALWFSDGTNYIIEFTTSPEDQSNSGIFASKKKKKFVNNADLTDALLSKLLSSEIAFIEIQNPYGNKPSRVTKRKLRGARAERIMKASGCFSEAKH